ncbi:hypothetical protein ACFX1T_036230 [Malus domestica]
MDSKATPDPSLLQVQRPGLALKAQIRVFFHAQVLAAEAHNPNSRPTPRYAHASRLSTFINLASKGLSDYLSSFHSPCHILGIQAQTPFHFMQALISSRPIVVMPEKASDARKLDLDISGNKFSGDVGRAISSCKQLTFLNLSMNHFNGPIPVMPTISLKFQSLGEFGSQLQQLFWVNPSWALRGSWQHLERAVPSEQSVYRHDSSVSE